MRNFKRVCALLMAMCMALLLFPALALDGPRFCAPEDVDLSQVREENGRLVGEILLPSATPIGEHKAKLLIDCPVPGAFPQAQQQKLSVEYKKITKDMLKAAIEAIGQSTKGGELYQFLNDSLNRHVSFEKERGLSSDFWVRHTTNDVSAHPKRRELLAARQTLRSLLEALGAQASEAFLPARRNTVDEALSFSLTHSSCAMELYELSQKGFLRNEARDGRDGSDTLSFAQACYALDGLPVMYQYSWKQGRDCYGACSSASVAVDDTGALVQARVEGVPVVKRAEPLAVPGRSWQELIRLWVANDYWPGSCYEDVTYEDALFGEVTNYATYEVLTAFEPCWVGREKHCLEPGWYTLVEQRVAKDDSLNHTSLGYVAATDMERIF